MILIRHLIALILNPLLIVIAIVVGVLVGMATLHLKIYEALWQDK
jgi:uncharacterized membrane protein